MFSGFLEVLVRIAGVGLGGITVVVGSARWSEHWSDDARVVR